MFTSNGPRKVRNGPLVKPGGEADDDPLYFRSTGVLSELCRAANANGCGGMGERPSLRPTRMTHCGPWVCSATGYPVCRTVVFAQPRPSTDIGRSEIPQRSSLLPRRDVLSLPRQVIHRFSTCPLVMRLAPASFLSQPQSSVESWCVRYAVSRVRGGNALDRSCAG